MLRNPEKKTELVFHIFYLRTGKIRLGFAPVNLMIYKIIPLGKMLTLFRVTLLIKLLKYYIRVYPGHIKYHIPNNQVILGLQKLYKYILGSILQNIT